MKAVLAVLAASLALLSACGSVESPDPEPNLWGEYLKSTNVKNDRFPSDGGSSEDRMANFAAYYSVEQLHSLVLSAFRCGTEPETDCRQPPAGYQTSSLFGRSVIVKHADGSLELLLLYVASERGVANRLIDSTGQTYTGLADFLDNNDLLSADDVIYAPEDITATEGNSKTVTVYGQTVVTWWPWAVGGLIAVVVLGVVLRLARPRRVWTPDPSGE